MTSHNKWVKIIATLGPASSSETVIRSLITNGVNVFRLNFSHGDHEMHGRNISVIRKSAEKLGREVGILADLQGPKIRTRKTADNCPVSITTGARVTITSRNVLCTADVISIDYAKIAEEISDGQEILINDGAIRLKVKQKKENGDLSATVLSGGEYSSHKGVNFPNVDLSIPSLTAKDRKDLTFITKQDIQFIALSFVRKAQDIIALRSVLKRNHKNIKVIAKIEKPEAARRINAILDSADGIMVARGDLGVEATPYVVPIIQKDLIKKANHAGKLVIVATQMLESMIHHSLPTRAESTDVANAIIDGSDAIMLSGETAVGHLPQNAVATMSRIASVVESSSYFHHDIIDLSTMKRYPPHALCEAAVWAGKDLGGIPLCVYTMTGETAFYLSKLRYNAPVFVFAPDMQVVRCLSLAWNIFPLFLPFSENIVQLHRDGERYLLNNKLVKNGTMIGIISGTNAIPGATNTFRIKRIGKE
jgi:pyruvate kinase